MEPSATSVLQCINARTGKREPYLASSICLRDAGLWAGIRLERWGAPPRCRGETPETQLLSHCLVLYQIAPMWVEARWSGEPIRRALVRPGSVSVGPAGWSRSGSWSLEGDRASDSLVLMIAPQVFQRIGAEISGSEVMVKPLLNMEDALVSSAILALEADVRQDSPLGPIYGETIAAALMTHLVHEHGEIAPDRLGRLALNANVAARVRDYIEAHAAEPILLGDLASLAGMEIHKVARAFKRTFGIAPHRYILRARVARAKAMLRKHELSLVDVALTAGFSNQSHFTKVFKKATGLSPSNYRKSVK